jgi:hypothetical protein
MGLSCLGDLSSDRQPGPSLRDFFAHFIQKTHLMVIN